MLSSTDPRLRAIRVNSYSNDDSKTLLTIYRDVAQLVACLIWDQKVGSSSLPIPTSTQTTSPQVTTFKYVPSSQKSHAICDDDVRGWRNLGYPPCTISRRMHQSWLLMIEPERRTQG